MGASRIFAGDASGWVIGAAGVATLVLDIVIDFVWAHPAVSRSDHPELNRRGHQLVGRTGVLVEPIVGGRGTLRIGDTSWLAEGPDAPAGAIMRVCAAAGTLLIVEPE